MAAPFFVPLSHRKDAFFLLFLIFIPISAARPVTVVTRAARAGKLTSTTTQPLTIKSFPIL